MQSAGYTEIKTKNDGTVCDLMGQSPEGGQIILNFLPDGRMKDVMFTYIKPDLSATGRIATARRCLDMAGTLDSQLADSFAQILDSDRAALVANTRPYPWLDTGYDVGITTGNKFWMQQGNR